MRHKLSMLPVLFAALAGLLSEAQAAAQLDPENSARVRVYREADITLYPGEYCYGADNPQAIHASDGAPSLFSFNKKVGMPVTDDIAGAYNEYVIPSGKPTAVMLQWQAEKDGVQASCGPIGATFFPQSGRNYDVSLGYAGNCFVQIRELHETSPGKATAQLAPAGASFACLTN